MSKTSTSVVTEKKIINVCAEILHFDVGRSYTDCNLLPFKSLMLSIDEDSQNLGLDGKVIHFSLQNPSSIEPAIF